MPTCVTLHLCTASGEIRRKRKEGRRKEEEKQTGEL